MPRSTQTFSKACEALGRIGSLEQAEAELNDRVAKLLNEAEELDAKVVIKRKEHERLLERHNRMQMEIASIKAKLG